MNMRWDDVDLARYERGVRSGWTAERTVAEALRDGVGEIHTIRLARALFGFGLAEAKDLLVRVEGKASGLLEYQETLLPALRAAFAGEGVGGAMNGEYRLFRQGGGRTAFAHVRVEVTGWDGRGDRVKIGVDPADPATAQPEKDAELFEAAKRGCTDCLRDLEGDAPDAKRWQVVLRRVLISLVDTRPDAMAVAAFLAVASALGAEQRFQPAFQDDEWQVVPTKSSVS
jgi:hypothetical protein